MKNGVLNKWEGEVFTDKYIKLIYKDNKVISVGQAEDGKFILNLEKITASEREVVTNLALTEDSLMGIIASVMLYCKHYNVDLAEKMDRIMTCEDISYICPTRETNKAV